MDTTLLLMIRDMPQEQQQYVMTLAASREKKTSTAYICWFVFGVHYFYLDKPVKNILYWITMGGLGIWAIIDLFRISSMVENYNKRSVKKLIQDVILAGGMPAHKEN